MSPEDNFPQPLSEADKFKQRVSTKSIHQLKTSIQDRMAILEKGNSDKKPIQEALNLLEDRFKKLTRLSDKKDVNEIVGSIRERKKQVGEIRDPKSVLANELTTEVSVLMEAHNREFASYVEGKNITQVELSIQDREKMLVQGKGDIEIIQSQVAILQRKKGALLLANNAVPVDKREDKKDNLDIRLEKFRLHKEKKIFPEAQPKFTLEQLQNSNAKEQVGKYTLCSDRVVRKDTSHPIFAGYDTAGRRVFGKLIGKNNRNFHAEANNYPKGMDDVEVFVQEKVTSDNIGTFIEDVVTPHGIVRIYPLGGKDLDSLMAKRKTLKPEHALSVTIETVSGLRELHKAGVLHMDISPANILITGDKTELIDFDDACPRGDDGKFHRGLPRGSRRNRPPELFEDNAELNNTADTYEASLLLYKLVVGEYPYGSVDGTADEKTSRTHAQHKRGKFAIPDSVPDPIKRILKRGINPNQSQRYQSADEMLNELLLAYDKVNPVLESTATFRQRELVDAPRSSPRLMSNPEAKLDPVFEVKDYLDHQSQEYLANLRKLVEQIPEHMEKDTELVACIPVAGTQEAKNIRKTLMSYDKQVVDHKKFEVLLLVNIPSRFSENKKDAMNATLSEIARAQKDFPNLRIRTMTAVLPDDQVRIGNIRKILTDAALLRAQSVGIKRDVLLLSNDADNKGLSPDYVNSFVEHFKAHPDQEGGVGDLRFDPQGYARFPVLHVMKEFTTHLDQIGFKHGNVTLYGNNSVMKSSIYAAIGGYPTVLKTAEQKWTGDTIRKLRKTRKTLGFIEGALLTTSIRRGLIGYLQDGKVQFGDEKGEEKMRALDLEQYPMFDWDNRQAVNILRQEIATILNQLIVGYEKSDKLGKYAWYYIENLRKVGILYKVQGDPKHESSTIMITDMSDFVRRNKLVIKMVKSGEQDMAKVVQTALK